MQLKTYKARSMAAALAEVKKDLGKDAVILHTRAYTVGGVLGVGGKQEFEITAAHASEARGPMIKDVARDGVQARPLHPLSATRVGAPAHAGPEEFVPSSFSGIGARKVAPTVQSGVHASASTHAPNAGEAAHLSDPAIDAAGDAARNAGSGGKSAGGGFGRGAGLDTGLVMTPRRNEPQEQARMRPAAPSVQSLATRVQLAPTDPHALGALQEELGSIRRMVGQILTNSRFSGANSGGGLGAGLSSGLGSGFGAGSGLTSFSLAGLSDPLLDLALRLHEVGVAPAISEQLLGSVRDELSPADLLDAGVVRTAVLRRLAAIMPVVGNVSRGREALGGASIDGKTASPVVIALVGPTGVGKTTTIAKLAAMYKLRYGVQVGLITIDTYRIAAVEQLRTYASIIGLPLRVALTPAEVRESRAALQGCGVVLLDTAGRSQHDAGRLDELREFVAAAEPDETHLVLSAQSAENVAMAASERFKPLEPTRVIFSKLDEAVSLGLLPTVAAALKLRVSFVTTGQEVPDHIELAQSDKLARWVLDGPHTVRQSSHQRSAGRTPEGAARG